jgi:hypothetical protein
MMNTDRKYIAISIKHSAHSKSPVLWGSRGKSANGEMRCFSDYTTDINKAELYSIEDFQKAYGKAIDWIKCDEPVKMCFDYVKRYKSHDTVLVDESELRNFLGFCKEAE